jgi:antitoxin (DNA-binding transcriptional repressor) of toxin-antitoxin stability system
MEYTLKETEKFLGQLMTAACAGEAIVVVREGKPIATLVRRGLGLKARPTGRLGARISYRSPFPLGRSRELFDFGFEE